MANNWNVLSGADKVRAYANNAADAGVQTSGYDDEILKEQRRRRDRDTADEIAAAQRAKYQAALAERRRAYEEALRTWGRRTDIYGQDMMDEEPVDPLAQMIDRQLMLGKGQEFPHSAPRQQGPTLDEALAVAPLEGLKGLTRGALAAPAFLGDIANLGYSGAKVLMGRPEEGIAPSEFPYGFEGATRWLANNVLGLGRDPVLEDVGGVGENIGILNPRAAILPARTLSGSLGKMLRRSPVVPELGRDLALPHPQYAALPAPRPEMDTTRWTDLMKEINRSIDEVNTPTRIPRPRPQRGGINPSELERLQPDLGDAARTLDRINEGPRRAAAQFKVLDPWGSMVDSVPTQFAGGGSVTGLARRLAQRSMPMFQEGMTPSMSPLGALSVVKPKGGNWLNGSVENALKGLKQRQPTWLPMLDGSTPTAADIEKLPDGNLLNKLSGEIMAPPTTPPINSWIEGPLTKYVKIRMASPDDEVRRLAEQGVLHFDPQIRGNTVAAGNRQRAGYPLLSEAKSETAQRWEDLVDAVPQVGTYREHVPFGDFSTEGRRVELQKIGGDFAVQNPNEQAYAFNRGRSTQDLGFDHLTDELRNALHAGAQQDALEQWLSKATTPEEIATARRGNPVDLPRHLQLTPDAVKNLSMEKAVRRVADINAWRAAQKAEADQKIAEGPGQELVREYPHTAEAPNPKGLRWVELKQQKGEKFSDEQLAKAMEDRGMHPDEIEAALKDPKQRAQIEEQAISDVGALARQLKYEGDTMGHCVSGYCDNVLSGRSRIFSLRDAKGEPHVIVEVEPSQTYGGVSGEQANALKPGLWEEYLSQQKNVETGIDELHAYLMKAHPDIYEQLHRPSIIQIKGKQNRKPKDEYLPFVQDFVKNPPHGAPWGDVGDLGNTGLFKVQKGQKWPGFAEDMPEGYYTPDEAQRLATEKGMDPAVLDTWMKKLNSPYREFASGGSVTAPAAGWEVLN